MKKRFRNLSEEELWIDISAGDIGATDELVRRYMPLVNSIVHKTRVGIPSHIDIDDLTAVGMMGLYDAIMKYEDQGNRFGTYAKWRVRGSVIDYLRSVDHGTRSMRKSERDVRNAVETLTADMQSEPTAEQIAAFLEIPLEEYYSIQTAVYAAQHVSFASFGAGDRGTDGAGSTSAYAAHLIDHSAYVDSMLEVDDAIKRLSDVFYNFSNQEQAVMSLYYLSDKNLKEIGDMLGVTESRACQIYTRTLDKIYEPLSQF